MTFVQLAWLIPVFPAIAFVLIAAFGHKTPGKGGIIALVLTALAGFWSTMVFFEVLGGRSAKAFVDLSGFSVEWWRAGAYLVNVGTYVDSLTAFMLLIVGILVTLIILYSQDYMHEEGEARRRYYAEMTLFITGMLGLVVANNYLMLFVFWEIMGLCSYLLIGYWYARPAAASAAKKAFLVTRIGDVFLFTGLAILFVGFSKNVTGGFHSLDFATLFANAPAMAAENHKLLLVANLCIFLGAVGKSAQFPLHVWLPDAMEGPTTVSALIHAATMVKAGVYLVARSYPLFVVTPEILVVVAVLGAFTAIFAASMALVNNDLKRVLAYSTLSQLGYMFLGLGVAGYLYYTGNTTGAITGLVATALSVAMFHLYSHAFFKAGLFLSAGSVGHALHSYDMRRMGGLAALMPFTNAAMLLGTISIAGIPPFSGFYSKDALLETVYNAGSASTLFLVLWAVGVLTAFMTSYYMFRLYLMTFRGEFRGTDEEAHHIQEAPPTMWVPLAILGGFAIFGAFVVFFFAGGGVDRWLVDPTAASEDFVAALVAPFTSWITYVSLAAAVGGFALAWGRFRPSVVAQNIVPDGAEAGMSRVLQKRYYIDGAYDAFAELVVLNLAKLENWFDQNVIDGVVNGVADLQVFFASKLRRWNTGNVQDYAVSVIGGFVLIVLLVIYVPQVTALISRLTGGP
ncbi:MAG: NADH-quinone oxidoreductase subunit L [Thermoplasmatota archaeon]